MRSRLLLTLVLLIAGCDQKEKGSNLVNSDITFYSNEYVDGLVLTVLLKIHDDSITYGSLGWIGTDDYYTYRVDSMHVQKGDITFYTGENYRRRHLEYDEEGTVLYDTSYLTKEYVHYNGFQLKADSTVFTHKYFELFDSRDRSKGELSKEVKHTVDSIR